MIEDRLDISVENDKSEPLIYCELCEEDHTCGHELCRDLGNGADWCQICGSVCIPTNGYREWLHPAKRRTKEKR